MQDLGVDGRFKMDLKEIGREVVYWIHFDQGRGKITGCCDSGNERSVSVQFVQFLD